MLETLMDGEMNQELMDGEMNQELMDGEMNLMMETMVAGCTFV
jgi:hypothetical protein